MPAPPRPSDEWRFTATPRRSDAKVQVARRAAGQFGRLRHDQLQAIGIAETTIRRWVSGGYLHPELPGIYAVGHLAPSTEGPLARAILYAGPGAMLSHATAAWWLGLLKYSSPEVHVSTPRRMGSRDGICVHGRRRLERIWHRGLPVSDPSQTILDFAATGPFRLLRLVLANADYQGSLELEKLRRLMGRGVAGSAPLREALRIHMPELARTRSRTEILLLEFCERYGLAIPEVNVYVEGWLVDAHWPKARLIVEVDGPLGHRSPAQLHTDHQRDLELRAAGYVILRYTKRQLIETPASVATDIRRYL
jgi:predicted transcriptional regulator of viral defense system